MQTDPIQRHSLVLIIFHITSLVTTLGSFKNHHAGVIIAHSKGTVSIHGNIKKQESERNYL